MTEINELIEFPLRLEDDQIVDADGDYICSVFPGEPEIGAFLVEAANRYTGLVSDQAISCRMIGLILGVVRLRRQGLRNVADAMREIEAILEPIESQLPIPKDTP